MGVSISKLVKGITVLSKVLEVATSGLGRASCNTDPLNNNSLPVHIGNLHIHAICPETVRIFEEIIWLSSCGFPRFAAID